MTNPANQERLLDDILGEGAPPGVREAFVGQASCLARRRRRLRQARVAALPLALILGLFFLVRHPHIPAISPGRRPAADLIVRTQPLPSSAFLVTQPLPAADLVGSRAAANTITTAAAGYQPSEIDDDELLRLAAPSPVVLVRHDAHHAELLFVNPD